MAAIVPKQQTPKYRLLRRSQYSGIRCFPTTSEITAQNNTADVLFLNAHLAAE